MITLTWVERGLVLHGVLCGPEKLQGVAAKFQISHSLGQTSTPLRHSQRGASIPCSSSLCPVLVFHQSHLRAQIETMSSHPRDT